MPPFNETPQQPSIKDQIKALETQIEEANAVFDGELAGKLEVKKLDLEAQLEYQNTTPSVAEIVKKGDADELKVLDEKFSMGITPEESKSKKLERQLIELSQAQDTIKGNDDESNAKRKENLRRMTTLREEIKLAKAEEFEASYVTALAIPDNQPKDFEGLKSKIGIYLKSKRQDPLEGGYPGRNLVIQDARSVMESDKMSPAQKKELLDMISSAVASDVLGRDASNLLDLYESRLTGIQ